MFKITKKKVWTAIGVLLFLLLIVSSGKLVEFVDNSECVVIQGIDGGLTVVKEAGPAWQGFGTATHYKKSNQLIY